MTSTINNFKPLPTNQAASPGSKAVVPLPGILPRVSALQIESQEPRPSPSEAPEADPERLESGFAFWTNLIGSTLGLRLFDQFNLLQQLSQQKLIVKFGLFYFFALLFLVAPVVSLIASFSQAVKGRPLFKISSLHPKLRGLPFAMWVGAFLTTLLPLVMMQRSLSFEQTWDHYETTKPEVLRPCVLLVASIAPIYWGRKFSKFAFPALLTIYLACLLLLLYRGVISDGGPGRLMEQFKGVLFLPLREESLALACAATQEAASMIPFMIYPLMEIFDKRPRNADISRVCWQLPMINGALFLLLGFAFTALGGNGFSSFSSFAPASIRGSDIWSIIFKLLTFSLALGHTYGSLLFMTSAWQRESFKSLIAILAPIVLTVIASAHTDTLSLHWQIEEATELGVWTIHLISLISIVYHLGITKLSTLSKLTTGHHLPMSRIIQLLILPLFFMSTIIVLPLAALASTVKSLLDLCSMAVAAIFLSIGCGYFFPAKKQKRYLESAYEQLNMTEEEFEAKANQTKDAQAPKKEKQKAPTQPVQASSEAKDEEEKN